MTRHEQSTRPTKYPSVAISICSFPGRMTISSASHNHFYLLRTTPLPQEYPRRQAPSTTLGLAHAAPPPHYSIARPNRFRTLCGRTEGLRSLHLRLYVMAVTLVSEIPS